VSVEPAVTRLRHQIPLLVWLVLVWILLWGTWSWANVISGVAMALVVTVLLPLPHVVGGTRVRPLAALHFLGRFVVDLVVSGAQVAWLTVRPGGAGRSAIVRVQLRTDSDLMLTMVAEAVSLVPGSLVLDLDREERLITVHLLGVSDLDAVAREKEGVLATEDRLVRAFGSAAEIAALDAAPDQPERRPMGRGTP
jgi:multicomponent Na+:H+ antiporter subunit E